PGGGNSRRSFVRGRVVGQRRELLHGRALVLARGLDGELRRWSLPPRGVDDCTRRNREHPGAEVFAMLEPAVRAQCAQKRLLEEVVRAVAARPPAQEREHLAFVGLVEQLEGGNAAHNPVKRNHGPRCEVMKLAGVGREEWVEFARVDHAPEPGEIVHALEAWEEPAGGGAVAAVQLANLAGSCLLFTALADDDLGRRSRKELEARGVTVHAGRAP